MSFWIIIVFKFHFFINISLSLSNIFSVADTFSGKSSSNFKKDFWKDFLNYYKKKKKLKCIALPLSFLCGLKDILNQLVANQKIWTFL